MNDIIDYELNKRLHDLQRLCNRVAGRHVTVGQPKDEDLADVLDQIEALRHEFDFLEAL